MSSVSANLSSPAAVDVSITENESVYTPQQQQQQQRAVLRCGDAWRGTYRPTIYPGRGRFLEGDIRDICCDFLLLLCKHLPAAAAAESSTSSSKQQQQGNGQNLPAEGTLELFLSVAVKRAACCLSKSIPLEDQQDVFIFLITVWEGQRNIEP